MDHPKGSHSRQQRQGRPVSGRIRSWRSDSLGTPGGIDGPSAAAERLFPSAGSGEGPRLARALRRERVLGAGEGAGYDLARHAALVRALARRPPGRKRPDKENAPGKEKAPRE
ncbi:MAG: hypothetical protein JNK84_06775 [Phreatobacter sp.]|uniref:hypothetical protein n=1 Tax=Phreatobacter sp. TaxID=1966341 RepID=UPI001A36D08A|nr:hypothetical protein [Phreatobacter sp.]MBL8568774.1 hypothetical protein [Phreatobacter sp.]